MNAYRRWAVQEYRQIEQKPPEQKAIGWKEDTSDTGMQEWLNQVILFAQDPAYAVEWIPEQLYDWLVGKGKIRKGQNEETEYLLLAVGRRQAWLTYQMTEDPTPKTRLALESFNRMKSKECYTGDEIPALLVLAKKIVLMQLIKPINEQLDVKGDRDSAQGRQDIGLQRSGEEAKDGEPANGTTGQAQSLQEP
jgi:hypothetical protein